MKKKLAMALAGAMLFASGAVVGFIGARLLGERGLLALMRGDPRHFAAMTLRRMSSDLDLSQEQQDKLRPIIMDTARQIIALRREQEPRMRELIDTSKELTRALLTPEQREKFTAVMSRLEAQRKAMDRFGPPPPLDGPVPPPSDFDRRPGIPPPPPDGFGPHPDLSPPPPDLFDPEWDLPSPLPSSWPESRPAPRAWDGKAPAPSSAAPGQPSPAPDKAPPGADSPPAVPGQAPAPPGGGKTASTAEPAPDTGSGAAK
jgi:Spy/CpxP family protein refolding chaperone